MSTIELLENDFWAIPQQDATGLMISIYSLRKKNIDDFSVEDLRLMIGQNIALDILIPKAISVLEENILAEGDYYEGDLLKVIVECDADYWVKHTSEKNTVTLLIKNKLQDLQEKLQSRVFKQVVEFIK